MEDDLLFTVQPSPVNSDNEERKEVEPVFEAFATLKITVLMPEGGVEFGLRYDPEADETVASAKTRLAQNWNCESVSLIFQGKVIEENLLVKHVDQLT